MSTATYPLGTIQAITRKVGIAGQVSYVVRARLTGSDTKWLVEFTGSTYGKPGPVTLTIYNGVSKPTSRVDSPERFGDKFDEQWVRNFFA